LHGFWQSRNEKPVRSGRSGTVPPRRIPIQNEESAMATWQIIVVVILAAAVAGLLILRSRQQQ
jgi:hypothetical protein